MIVGIAGVLMLLLFFAASDYMQGRGERTTKAELEEGIEHDVYTPISEGWKASKSVSDNLTGKQKKEIDGMVESWKEGSYSDTELKEELEAYLNKEEIAHMEVSVKSSSPNLMDEIPEIELQNGGNLYSFLGIYSTGEQNPEGTKKTVCHQWSVFIF